MNKIVIVGAGSFGTALANSLSYNNNNKIILLTRNKLIAESINNSRINIKYFPYFLLNENIESTTNISTIKDADIIFLAIPSNAILDFIKTHKIYIPTTIIVNLAKGIGRNNLTLIEDIKSILKENKILSMKGPTFADELLRGFPSGFTVGYESFENFNKIKEITKNTNIILDSSEDFKGVELVSVLKNIYAITLGIIDAHFNSLNTRFLILTKIVNEVKKILQILDIDEQILYRYCGIGDIGLTGLNDLSRNRTLGLMIGKNFLNNSYTENNVILEGVNSIQKFHDELLSQKSYFYILDSLYKLLKNKISTIEFINSVLNFKDE